MGSPLVSRAEASKKPTHHQYIRGVGYLAHSGPPELPPTANGSKNCDAPAGTADRSQHLLRPPNGAPPIAFIWMAQDKAWASTMPERGNRLAWPVAHLRRAGWEYVEPLTATKS